MEWLSNAGTIVLVAFGIGAVIFIHECGHFFAARWCGVRVECFSLGFGPRLLGWKRGPTTYQLALLPLGGYVKMAGEEVAAGGKAAPDELPSKSVGQRFLIYSGGVLANVLTCLIVFPILFAIGVPVQEPLVGSVAPGSPAWNAGIAPGSRIERVNDRHITKFSDIATEVALGNPSHAEVEYVDPAGARHVVGLVPKYDEDLGIYTLGFTPGDDREGKIAVDRQGAAARAGLREGDRVVGIDGAVPGLSLLETMRLALDENMPLKARVVRDGKEFEAVIAPEEDPKQTSEKLGVEPEQSMVVGVRENPTTRALGLAKDDRLITVNGHAIGRRYDLIRALAGPQTRVVFEFERAGERRTAESGPLDAAAALQLAREIALGHDPASTRVNAIAGGPASLAGVKDGDRIVEVGGVEPKDWESVRSAIQKQDAGAFALVVERVENGTATRVELKPVLAPWKFRSFGFAPLVAQYEYKVSGVFAPMKEGWLASWNFLEEGWLTLKRIFTAEVSGSKNLGGIITIGVVSKKFADNGIIPLLFFLCMLSMNLAFLNVLPIPVLDGGHLLFLLIEKIKGSPVSERVMGYSQMVGIVLILSLMVIVTFFDVMRLIGN